MSVVPEKALLRRIRDCGEREQEVVEALSKLDKLGPARLQNDLVDWNTEQGLLLYRGQVMSPRMMRCVLRLCAFTMTFHSLDTQGRQRQWSWSHETTGGRG